MIYNRPNGTIHWHDAEHRILIAQITAPITWGEIYEATCFIDEVILAQPHPVYTVYLFKIGFLAIPAHNMLSTIGDMLQMDNPNEALIIFVNSSALQSLIRMASLGQRTLPILKKHRYTTSLDEALAIIAEHRAHAP